MTRSLGAPAGLASRLFSREAAAAAGALLELHVVGADLAVDDAADLHVLGLHRAVHGGAFADGHVAALDITFDPAVDLNVAAAHHVAVDPKIGTDDRGHAGLGHRLAAVVQRRSGLALLVSL